MKQLQNNLFILIFLPLVLLLFLSMGENESVNPGSLQPVSVSFTPPIDSEMAVFAGGCFWGVEGVFESLKGVLDAASGYSGGPAESAHYDLVGTGRTGHAESVRVYFDPKEISYNTLLQVFFIVAHDPTQLNYQGPDVGTQYRSAIFYTDTEQKIMATEYIDKLEQEKRFPKPIVTQLVPLEAFYPAEEYHQDFLRRNPSHPYIVYWDLPKLRELKKEFPNLLKQ